MKKKKACGLGPAGATLESVEGYEPHCRFDIKHAVDHFTVDVNKSHGRIDARGALVDAEGRTVELVNTGLISVNEVTLPLIQSAPDAKTAPFGHGREWGSLFIRTPNSYGIVLLDLLMIFNSFH